MLPTIMFDTSGINKLLDLGAASEVLMKGFKREFNVLITGINALEVIANKQHGRREKLLSIFPQLSSKFIWPPNEIFRRLVAGHMGDPSQFKWTRVNVRAREYELGFCRRDFDDELCVAVKDHHRKLEHDFLKIWKSVLPLDDHPAKQLTVRPKTYRETVAIAARDGGVLWKTGQRLYAGADVSKTEPTEAAVKDFMDACPPFRAMCYGFVMAWYNWSFVAHGGNDGKRMRAGFHDLMSAAYLPYCDCFVSEDTAQVKNLREIAIEAAIDCEILKLDEFDMSSFLNSPVSREGPLQQESWSCDTL